MMQRRKFLGATATLLAGAALEGCRTRDNPAASAAKPQRWPIGCFNRPWVNEPQKWSLDVALDGIKEAGYTLTGLLTPTKEEPLIGSEATPEYLASLRSKIQARGLSVVMGALHTKNNLPLEDQIKDLRRQIDNGHAVGANYLLTFGVDRPAWVENYYAVMRDAAPYAHERGLKLVLKPHGGSSGAAQEILRCLKEVNHPNFKIWFDAGNIIYYTGLDPVEQLKPIARYVTGFCAKDCDRPRGQVWLEFGSGKVDFAAVFRELKRADFHGPVMVECCAQGPTPAAVSEGARRNREYLERLFAQI